MIWTDLCKMTCMELFSTSAELRKFLKILFGRAGHIARHARSLSELQFSWR